MLVFRKNIKKIAAYIAVFSFFLQIAEAGEGSYFSGCTSSRYTFDVMVEVDYLYWKPCISDLKYAAAFIAEEDFGSTAVFEIQAVEPQWEGGYRLQIKGSPKDRSAFSLFGSLTHLEAKANDLLVDENLSILPTFAHPLYSQLLQSQIEELLEFKEASAAWESEYNQWDIGIVLCPGQWGVHAFNPFIGVAGIHFDERFSTQYFVGDGIEMDGTAIFSHAGLELTGVGLKMGTDYQWTLSQCCQFFAFADAAVLISDSDCTVKFGTVDSEGAIAVPFPNYEFREKGSCTVVPGYHLGLGIRYNGCICGYPVIVNAAYECSGWHHVPDPRSFIEGDDGVEGTNNLSNIALSKSCQSRVIAYHGVSVGAGMTF